MTDSNETPFVRLPVREMRDEPAPQRAASVIQQAIEDIAAFIDQPWSESQDLHRARAALASLRAAQEGGLPPLPHWCEAGSPMAQQMQSYARLALAAAGGGVPKAVDPTDPGYDVEVLREHVRHLERQVRMLASSPQPEAAPAVAQVPTEWREAVNAAREAMRAVRINMKNNAPHLSGKSWGYLDQALERLDALAAAPEAPAQAEVSERVTEFNVGRWCLSEDDCIAQGIDFSAYELGVADAAKAFGRNTTETPKVAGEPVAWVNRDELDNMLDDRTATVAGIRSGWRKTPLYLHPPTAQAAPSAGEVERELLLEALDIQRRTLGHGTELHLAMIDWALRASAALSHKEQQP